MESTLNWIRGLHRYFEYTGNSQAKTFMAFLEKSLYADNPVINTTNQKGMIEFIGTIRKFAPDQVFDIFHKYFRYGYDPIALQDGFSRGQVESKIWISEELKKINDHYSNIILLAGWYGQLRLYLDAVDITYDSITTIDFDENAGKISDEIFNNNLIENWKMKSCTQDILDITQYESHCVVPLVKGNGETFNKNISADLIVNTSAEHMNEEWFYKIKTNSVIAIQSNNLFDIPEHINCVTSIDSMKKKFKLKEIFYEGEKDLWGYKRFMLIGKK